MLVLPCAGRRPAGLGSTGALGDEWYVYIGRSANVMCTEELHKPAAKWGSMQYPTIISNQKVKEYP